MIWVGGASLVADSNLSQEWLGGASLIVIVGGMVAAVFTAKTRTQRDALVEQVKIAEGAAQAWKEERDAAVVKSDRLAEELKVEATARAKAEARTDVTRLEKQIAENQAETVTILKSVNDSLREIARNTAAR